jgi:hypothetical protein
VYPSAFNAGNNPIKNNFLSYYWLGPATTTIGGKITLIGVASYGIKDEDGSYCSPKLPSAYARVSTQLDWIQKNSDVSQWECNKE